MVLLVALAGGGMFGCERSGSGDQAGEFSRMRNDMVRTQIAARGVRDEHVLAAMRQVPRHLFVPRDLWAHAYDDRPLPIGEGQTISQPYIVGLMSELLRVGPGDRVLEIGTGSGYQAAVLAAMGCEVYSIEIREPLARTARERLAAAGYPGVQVRVGDGYQGWPEAAPFAGIIVTAAPDRIPEPLLDQLRLGGKMAIPVGDFYQTLKVLTRGEDGISERSVIPVRFVPMTGEVEKRP